MYKNEKYVCKSFNSKSAKFQKFTVTPFTFGGQNTSLISQENDKGCP